ncbi:hypothetical protein MNBD_ALPHA02-662 [hydrothermal vent metagenome]|uniref:PAS domain-containing protein n=1 Tax=hydrothermal vent metagenome TaxID=652676 RepID=A0A3B0S3F6_9ZZZZ
MWQPKSNSFNNPLSVDSIPEKHPARRFYNYWKKLCGDGDFARKSDFNPADIVELLPNIAMTRLDYSGSAFDIILTLAGERIKDLLQIKGSGTYRKDFFTGDALDDRLHLYDHIAKKPREKFFRMRAPFKGREFNEYIVGLFPFSNDGETITHIFLVIESI